MSPSRASSIRNTVLLTLAALLPIALIAGSCIVLASNQVTTVVNKQVQTTASVSSLVIGEQISNLVVLVESYANRPSLAASVVSGAAGAAETEFNLTGLAKAVPGISASFVASLQGISLATYPLEPSIIGTNFSYRNWYKGLVATGRVYVSDAIVTKEAGNPLAVTVTDYIKNSHGVAVGILGANYGLQYIQSYSAKIAKAQGVTLIVTDRTGTSLTAGGTKGLVSLARDPGVLAALAGHSGLLQYSPVLAGGGHGPPQLSAYTQVAGTGWGVVASVPDSTALAGLNRLRYAIVLIAGLLVLALVAGTRVVVRSNRRRQEYELEVQSRDRQLVQVLDSTDEGFLSIDEKGLITAWNSRAEALYGWKAQEIIGHSLADTIIPADRRASYKEELANYRAGMGSAIVGQRLETTRLHRDGHEIPVELSVWPHDHDGGFSSFVHDISDRVTIRADLESARDDAMRASRMKSEFLANMSHEIRTPMNGVIGMSGLLLNTDLDDEQRDFAETVCSSAEALLTVIDDILDFSKIEAGKLDVESVIFDLRSVVEESATLLAARAHQNGLELTCRIDPDIPPALEGDPGRLRQVLLNLLGNAVKFTSAGEVNVSADLSKDKVEGGVVVELSVRDTGIGMTGASLEHLFDAFVQADSSTSRRFGGTGLGLAISRQLVELMGGRLSVSSEPGCGSTFTTVIPFPLGPIVLDEVDAADIAGARALIVDDNITNQRVLEEMLAGWGCSAVSSEGAVQAFSLMRRSVEAAQPFDVLLLDLNMPDIDGYELARMVRADPRLILTPMIMLTSSAQRGEEGKAQQLGIAAYLTKPVRSAQLLSALSRVLGPVSATPNRSRRVGDRKGDVQILVSTDGIDSAVGPGDLDLAHVSESNTAETAVLVVEDNLINQKVFTAMLTSIGYQSDVAVNGFEALEALENNRYDAVFMDCQMPVMDGYETTQKLREREGPQRHTRVIAVTASAMATDRDRCLDSGMDDYMTKPISVKELAAKLTYWLN
jgi:PAS domain S-box-containing protein